MQARETISIKEMLEVMQSGEVFRLTCVTYDKQRKKGGRILVIHEACIPQRSEKNRITETKQEATDRKRRAAKHVENYTRNITLTTEGHPTSQVVKIHPPLVMTFNGKTVTAK